MGKIFGSSCLISGTAIGAGMLALPMVWARVGLMQAIGLMIGIWLLAYYSALLGAELNLRARTPLSLGAVSRRFSGRGAELIGQASFMLLCYALLAAYLDGSSSVISTLMQAIPNFPHLDGQTLLHATALCLGAILLLSMVAVDYINRILFATMILVLIILAGILAAAIPLGADVQLAAPSHGSVQTLGSAVPVVFTSFGFQIIFHTICHYLDMDQAKIKRAFFWGSLIPAIVYIGWTAISLTFILYHRPELFAALQSQSLDVGDFIYILSQAADAPFLKLLSWGLSILAVITSAIGVGLGLTHTWQALIKNKIASIALVIIPPYLIALNIPEAFIQALGFAGMVLVIIALLLPIYLLYQSDAEKTYYSILDNKPLRWIVIMCSIAIMTIETLHLLKWL